MDHGIRVASCKRGNWRLLDKVFESKSIKREDKSLFWQFKTFTQTFKSNVFTIHQQLCNCSYFSKPLHLKEVEQHERSASNEERMKQLDKVISQDVKKNQDNDWYAKDGKEHEEDNRSGKYNNYRDERIYSNSKY